MTEGSGSLRQRSAKEEAEERSYVRGDGEEQGKGCRQRWSSVSDGVLMVASGQADGVQMDTELLIAFPDLNGCQ